ncbi:MAG TPA: hypothetical protein PKK36_04940 [Kiritimatiellia bacterium]|jgi:hypothetical protein|nr:hypothetical protein [Kiritimatiellia bacterium]HPA77744.1 hypothetical protein [Kiritimatiellia bacterium]HQQ04508.1 hypothetical protein [Kiritimatiellia bacterium]
MDIEKNKSYAVLTGDIVGSTSLPSERRGELHDIMKKGAKDLKRQFKTALPLEFDIFSGDSWQMLIVEPWHALRIALYFRAYIQAYLVGLDTRIAIAVGSVEFLPKGRVSEGDGEAFRLSGRLLQEKNQTSRMRFAGGRRIFERRGWDAAFYLMDALIMRAWTDKRAKAMLGALQGWPQEQIATLWDPPIRQQSVTEHLQGAAWETIRAVLKEYEHCFGGTKKNASDVPDYLGQEGKQVK